MAQVGNIVVVNGLLAVGLAIVVAMICSRIRQPAVRHVLWVLVLLRLLAPPIFLIDLSQPNHWVRSFVAEHMAVPNAEFQLSWQMQWSALKKVAVEQPRFLPLRDLYASQVEQEEEVQTATSAASSGVPFREIADRFLRYGLNALVILWVLGSVACLSQQIYVAYCFCARIGTSSYHSGIWQRRADALAKRMGLKSCPQVRLVRDTLSPMLWGLGPRAQILLPDRLLERLDRRGQDGLLCHELAHYQRGDHWIRLVESLAFVVYWWHPVFWWARYEIEKSEELCCDAVAVSQVFGNRRSYAEGLLQAVDFVSAPSFPPAASGALRSGLLRRRIELVMSKRAGWVQPLRFGPGLVLLFAVVLLPFPILDSMSNEFQAVAATGALKATVPPVSSSMARLSLSPEKAGEAECKLETDSCHRTHLFTKDGSIMDLGVGRVSVSARSQADDCIAIGTTDGSVEVVSTETGQPLWKADVGHAAISHLCFSSDDRFVSVAGWGGELLLLDADDGGRLLRIRKQDARAVQLSFDGALLNVVWSKRGVLSEQTYSISHF